MVSKWARTGATATFDIEIPPNTTATGYIPAGDVKDVREGGRAATEVAGVRFVRMEDGCAVFGVGSGVYRFESSSVPAAGRPENATP